MTWARFSDDFSERLDIITLSDAAWRVDVEAIIWSNRFLTDGAIPAKGPRFFAHPTSGTVDDAVAELVDAGVWEVTDDGWQLAWSDQRTRADVEKDRAEAAGRQERQRRHNKGDHSLCDPSRCWALLRGKDARSSDVTRDVTRDSRASNDVTGNSSIGKPADVTRDVTRDSRASNAVSHGLPSRPVPSRPDPKGGTGREGGGGRRSGAGPATRSARATRSAGSPAAQANRGEQVTAKARKPEQTHAGLTAGEGPSSEDAPAQPVDWAGLQPLKAHPFSGNDESRCASCGVMRKHLWHIQVRAEDGSQCWGSEWRAEHDDEEGPAA